MSGHQSDARISFMVDPLAMLALATLVVNDRWLKPNLRNALTGKLSDLALCCLLPLFFAEIASLCALHADQRRLLNLAACAAAVIFTVLELSVTAARWACSGLALLGPWLGIHGPFVMTRDATDLLALPMVLLAVAWGRHKISQGVKGSDAHMVD